MRTIEECETTTVGYMGARYTCVEQKRAFGQCRNYNTSYIIILTVSLA